VRVQSGQFFFDCFGRHRHAILKALPVAHQDLTSLEINIPYAQVYALNALVFLYATVLRKPFGQLSPVTRAKRPRRLPTVLRQAQTGKLLAAMNGQFGLMARLLCGAGLRLTECLVLRTGRHRFVHRKVFKKAGNLSLIHFKWMAFTLEENEAPGPMHISIFRPT
jgi:integrase